MSRKTIATAKFIVKERREMFIDTSNSRSFTVTSTRESPHWGLTVEDGVHWLLAPNGEKFYGSGVNGVDAGSPPEEVEDGLLTTFRTYTLRLTIGRQPSAIV